jgi:multicomponent Na+:H+ antiporter subunit E
MSLLWLGFNGTDWNSWIVGGPVVLAAAGLSVKLLPILSGRWSPRGAIAFAGFFVRESLRGGWDVAWRAFSSKPSLSPGILCFPSRLPEGTARLWFCGTISLLPGTAVVAIAEKEICVHVLDITPHAEEELRELERRVAALFGLELPGQKEESP